MHWISLTDKNYSTAPASAEKRHLLTNHDDNASQHPKRTRLSTLRQPDVVKDPSPPTKWLNTVLGNFDTSDATPSWGHHESGPGIGNEPMQRDDWHGNDASVWTFDTWSHKQASFGSPSAFSHSLQGDTTYSIAGQTGYENETKTYLDSDHRTDWETMDLSYESTKAETPNTQPTLRVSTTPDPPTTLTTRSGDNKKTDAAEHIQLNGLDGYYDTCFGVIQTSVTTSFTRKEDTAPVPVRLTPSANFLKIYFEGTNKYAGIVTLPVLSRLLTESTTKLDATLRCMPRDSRPKVSRKNDKHADKFRPNSQASLRLVVYGAMKESAKIGRLLSDADLYLQHPAANECDMDVE
ncbi:hypothetical protein LX36DRAFT_483323 [Colletotrichum falcatum]|nr:hypothetical protein LX36DRAFT_483323 [Colletotrichum falcatum]